LTNSAPDNEELIIRHLKSKHHNESDPNPNDAACIPYINKLITFQTNNNTTIIISRPEEVLLLKK